MTHYEYTQAHKPSQPCTAAHITFGGVCLNCGYDPAPKPASDKLNWRTKKDQYFQSAGCSQQHVIRFAGTCECCGRMVYSHGCVGEKPCGDMVGDSPDPRGIIPAFHCLNVYRASEYEMRGRDAITCAHCADDGDKYRGLMAALKSSGTWSAAA